MAIPAPDASQRETSPGPSVLTQVLAGITVSLAMVPESLAFTFVAGVSPIVGLHAAALMGLCTAVLGAQPGVISGAAGATAVVFAPLVASHGPEYLFDLGKEVANGTTPYEMKDSRETWYSKQRVKEHSDGVPYTGGVKLSSHAYGDNLKNYNDWSKPEFARQPVIRDNFFRSTGVMRKTTTF